MTNPETQVASFFAKYERAKVELGKALRARLRARLPGLIELVYVYENQNSLVFSYSPTERGADGVCAFGVDPRGVNLYFGSGALLAKSDPKKLLKGSGKTVRHVAMNSIADFDRAEIDALITAALDLAKLRLDPKAKGPTVIKAEEQKKRGRRAKATQSTKAKRSPKARR